MSGPEADRLPPAFEARMAGLLGDELEEFVVALRAPAAGLRANTLRVAPEELLRIAPVELTPLPFPPEGFTFEPTERPGRHPYHDAGLYYLQDPGAMAVGAMVDPRAGELVLDLAAAPGGKATHLAARIRGEGVLVANDVHPERARDLARNLERLGVRNAMVTAESPERLANRLGAVFDRVLVDAPCSGESMFHKSPAAVADWSPAAVTGCARRQTEILEHAARLVRPGGLLVYSTCTFSPEENEEAIARFLRSHPEFGLMPLETPPGGSPGRSAWVDEPLRREDLGLTTRLWPHRVPGAGHFVAGLRREGWGGSAGAREGEGGVSDRAAMLGATVTTGTSSPGALARPRDAMSARRGRGREAGMLEASRDAVASWLDFRERHLPTADLGDGARLVTRGDDLHAIPPDAPDLADLRGVAYGLWLGTLRKGRFDPSHALAMALRRDDITRPVALASDTPEIEAYLRGETLADTGPGGWTVVTVDGFPIGWGKRVGEVIKNHYPRGLRRR